MQENAPKMLTPRGEQWRQAVLHFAALEFKPDEWEQDLIFVWVDVLSVRLEPQVLRACGTALAEAPHSFECAARFRDDGRLDVGNATMATGQLRALLGPALACPTVDLEQHVRAAVRTFLFGVASGSAQRGAPVS